jgi:hypothetical protein
MTGIEELRALYLDKLARTGSFDKAFLKACWVAYERGYKEGATTPEVELQPPKWARETGETWRGL